MHQRATGEKTCLSVFSQGKFNRLTVCEEGSVKRFSDTGSIPAGSTTEKSTPCGCFFCEGSTGCANPWGVQGKALKHPNTAVFLGGRRLAAQGKLVGNAPKGLFRFKFPPAPPTKNALLSTKTKVRFLNDVCLWQMMLATPMMTASPNDAWLRHILGQTSHHCDQREQHHFERSEKHHIA